jgi:hypothetical protein
MTPNDFREDGSAAASRTSTTAPRFRRIFGSATLHADWANLIPPSKYLAFPLIAVEAFVNNARADKAFGAHCCKQAAGVGRGPAAGPHRSTRSLDAHEE